MIVSESFMIKNLGVDMMKDRTECTNEEEEQKEQRLLKNATWYIEGLDRRLRLYTVRLLSEPRNRNTN
jgi:hypothetical protein